MGDDESTWDTSTLLDGQTMMTLSDIPTKDCAIMSTSPTTAILHAAQRMAPPPPRPQHRHPLDHLMTKPNPADRVAYMAGQDDFRAARVRCNDACIEYNSTPEHASTAERAAKWLNIVDPYHKSKVDATQAVAIADVFSKMKPAQMQQTTGSVAVGTNKPSSETQQPKSLSSSSSSSAQAHTKPQLSKPNTAVAVVAMPRPTFPYVKMPIYMDYGLRVHISPTTFINRNCFIMDTPVADIRIGDRCQIGPNVSIIGVGHSTKYEERNELETGEAGSWGAKVDIGKGVWIGANSTILPGVTIGDYTTIGAGSVVTRDLPARCVAVGNPAKILYMIDEGRPPAQYAQTALTLEEALQINASPEPSSSGA